MSTQAPESVRTDDPIISVRDLSIDFFVEGEWFPAASNVSYDVHPGEVLAIVGESGSGKSQSSMSLLGLLPANGRATGSAKLGDTELIGLTGAPMRKIRGNDVAVIFQEPMTALNPVYPVGFQIVETLRTHFDMGPTAAKKRAIELLTMVEMPDPVTRYNSYPHQLSGGQRQRAMIAQSLACEPKLLIADEPTTALDVTVQAEILKLMRDLRNRIDAGIILITHDMGVVADMADKLVVMRRGEVVERGSADEIFNRPQHEYTRELLTSVPHLGGTLSRAAGVVDDAARRPPQARPTGAEAASIGGEPVLEAVDLEIEYPKRGRTPAFKAVDQVSLTIAPGEVVGLVGESGSGKTTIGRAVVGLLPVSGGHLKIDGQDMVGIGPKELRALRKRVGIVFQDPGSSLNPRLPIGESIGEPLYLNTGIKGPELTKKIDVLLDQVELPRSMRNRYPHELSGGQRQRVGIARALSLEPSILVADEPTSALDVSVQAHVLELFQELQREHGFATLFISHDLAVVEMLATRIAVMHHGKLAEIGPTDQIVQNPQDPYTQRLIAAVPVPDPAEQKMRRERRDVLLAEAAAELAAEEQYEVEHRKDPRSEL
ncbi:ABC transporter ATP-binding protein [Ruania alba]|uniref:Peptide/nickel transport system ATP-binding protein n=1 Tax=Ruania alba TaxID=648782 RepID=A0A1H5N709_9MICO|nr:ABC transporter ATP-binding protein [Ruania alba]SEE97240.1 peptide/nickel transport system ATP-binding protein [Ruania alba]